MENHKRLHLACDDKDRISNLPQHLIASILERLPVQDAVRTSILSKNWRYRWTTMIVLVFDKQFSNNFAKRGAFGCNGSIRIINHVLILHNGPITKLSLHIPQIYFDSFQEVDQMMLLISRKSVQELVLNNSNRCYELVLNNSNRCYELVFYNSNRCYELPAYLSSCSKLRKLELENCIFKPLLKFEVFSNLECLHLKDIDFGSDSCGALVTLPQLQKLWLVACKNVHNFNIKASKLRTLLVFGCVDALLIRLLDTPCLNTVALYFLKPVEDFVRVERMNLARLLSSLPKIKKLCMDGHFMNFLNADKFPKWLPDAVSSLSHLRLENFQLSDLDQLHGALCFLRNSPNLETLSMIQSVIDPHVMHYDVGPASNHLESSDCLDQTLGRLRIVEITTLKGSRLELLFIKVLLAHSPSLEKLTIQPSGTSDAHERLNIAMDVMRFPRASTKAELIFLNPKR